jgi:glycosyltransferase involved in cell wall biosynthesis
VALVSVGIGRRQRGFERMFTDLFEVLQEQIDVVLFKSGGSCGPRERIPRGLGPATALARRLPLGNHSGGRGYRAECLAYGLSLLPELLRHGFDVIHCADPPLARVLQHLTRACGLRSRLLFTEGCRMPPRYYPRVAHVHHVGEVAMHEAVSAGVPLSQMTLIPVGVHTQRFASAGDRQQLRRKHGIADTTFVMVVVSNLERVFKRVDYIIEEVSRLGGDVLLWIDGHPDDPSVADLARQRLGGRCRITYVPSSDVPDLYAVADVMIHGSVDEAFGLAVVEALCSGLTVLAHDCRHFEWLIGDRDDLVDMSQPGRLAVRLGELIGRRDLVGRHGKRRAAAACSRFDWRALAPAYIDMYQHVAAQT